MAAVTAQNCIYDFVREMKLCRMRMKSSTYLVEGIEEFRNQRGARRRRTKSLHETKLLQVTDEAVGREVRESQRVSPEIPLESDD